MNLATPHMNTQHLLAASAMTLLLILNASVLAGPGAHGPNGEHLDAPSAVIKASSLPRMEAKSEGFELVVELRASELVIVVDRYETNEPVLGAKIEVESGGLKAIAAFRAEQGDYVVTDAALLKALKATGEHGLVFTLVAGVNSDLLDGTLVTAAGHATSGKSDQGHSHDDHGHDHELERAAWIGGGVAALGLIGGFVWRRQRRRSAGAMKGAL